MKAEPHCALAVDETPKFAGVDLDRFDHDSVPSCVVDQNFGRIETHRLHVEDRRQKDRGLVTFDVRRRIGEQGETRCVRLREAILAEAEDLLVQAIGEIGKNGKNGKKASVDDDEVEDLEIEIEEEEDEKPQTKSKGKAGTNGKTNGKAKAPPALVQQMLTESALLAAAGGLAANVTEGAASIVAADALA